MKHLILFAAALGSLALFADELELAGLWTARSCRTGEFPCAVPGGVQSALLKAGRIPDTFIGTNEVDNLWIGKTDWTLTRSFDVPKDFLSRREIILRLEDCDTFAEILLNGTSVGTTSDRFQRYDFKVKPFLKTGCNTIEVRFRSPEQEADSRRFALGRAFPISNVMWAKNQALIRKPACHAGWDWGPSVQVVGLCGTTKLIASDAPRIDYVYSTQDFNADLSHCTLTTFADLSDGTTVTNVIEIDNPPLWWPNGAGEQRFYEYEFKVADQRLKRRIGLRKIEVLNERTVSADGKDELSLVFRVNNRRLFMKGANWIPCSAYENEQTPERYRNLLKSAKAANMNMIRLWGGGQYEKDIFYDTCDELGLLLWHDMMCACAVYPGEGVIADEIKAELKHQLRRLRDHASIAMWCGDNECLGAVKWFPETNEDPDYYRGEWIKRSKLQGELVAKYDPRRTYWPSSPCCGPGDFGDGWKEDSKGDMHNWDVWHANEPFAKYYEYHPRFCSEFGFQSFPSMEVAETFATREQILARAPEFEWHQKNAGGNERIRKTMERYFPAPKDVPAELLLSQFQQAMAIQTAVDGWRAEQPRCMGTLFWQLNDNWPVASWSSIEYGGKWKPLQYLAKRFYAPLHIVRSPDGTVSVINDTTKDLFGAADAIFYGFDGKSVETERIAPYGTRFPANAATKVGKVALRKDAVLSLCFNASDGETQMGYGAHNFPVLETYRGVELPLAKVTLEVEGFCVTVKTDRPAFWVWLDTPGIAGRFSDNAFTLQWQNPHIVTFIPSDPKTTPEEFRKALKVTHLTELTNTSRAEALRAKLDSNDRDYVFVVMHRGDWRHAPENSVGAIEGAIAMGADVIELDASPTKDGHFVLLHDGTLDRVSNGKGASKDLTLAEIKQYRLKNDDGSLSNYEIMTLEEAFALTKGRILVNIDKYSRDVKGITECVLRCGVAREVIFKARMRHDKLKKKLGPELWTRFVKGELYYMPILDWDKYDEAEWKKWAISEFQPPAYEMCFPEEPANGDFAARLAMGPSGQARIWINTLWDSLCAGHTDERGYKGDAAGSWGWCLDHGATIIQTDRPEELINYLTKLKKREM